MNVGSMWGLDSRALLGYGACPGFSHLTLMHYTISICQVY
jgi:hypothetical protein